MTFARFDALACIRWVDYCVGAVIGPIADLLLGLLPVLRRTLVEGYYHFIPLRRPIVEALGSKRHGEMNGYLRDRIQERARLAWNRPNRSGSRKMSRPVGCCRWVRNSSGCTRCRPVGFASAQKFDAGNFP